MMFFILPLGYFIRILYAKNLPIELYGLLYAILGIVPLVSMFNDLGFSETLNYFIPRFLVKKNWTKARTAGAYALFIQTITAFLISLIVFFNAAYIADKFFHSPSAVLFIKIFILMFFFYNIAYTLKAFMNGLKEISFVNGMELLRLSLIYIFSLVLIFIIKPIQISTYLAIIWVGAYSLSLIIFGCIFIRRYPQIAILKINPNKVLFKKMFHYAIYVMFGTGALFILTKIDIVVVTFMLGVQDVAYYTTALSIMSIIPMFLIPISGLILPLVSELNFKKDNKKIKKIIETFYNIILPLVLPFILIFIAYPSLIIKILFTKEFLPSALGIVIFSIASIFNIIYTFNFSLLAAFGLVKQRTKLLYIAAALNLVLDIFLVIYFGYIGVVIATSLIWVFLSISTFLLIKKRIYFKVYFFKLLKTLLAGFIFLAFVSVLKQLISLNPYIESGLIIILSLILYFILIIIFKAINLKKTLNFVKIIIPAFVWVRYFKKLDKYL